MHYWLLVMLCEDIVGVFGDTLGVFTSIAVGDGGADDKVSGVLEGGGAANLVAVDDVGGGGGDDAIRVNTKSGCQSRSRGLLPAAAFLL
jgi:hypothetical protein